MVYVQASIKLRPGKLQDFVALLNELTPVLARHGWKLQGSYASVIGRVNTVTDLWEVTDPNAVGALMGSADLQKYGPRIAEIIEDEVLTVMTRLPIG
jgi:hypothetical protein